jgi:hypothetical protein
MVLYDQLPHFFSPCIIDGETWGEYITTFVTLKME